MSQIERARRNNVSPRQQRTLDKIARERPDLHERIKQGELKIHRACIEAGHIRELTPLDALKRAWGKASEEERGEFLVFIQQTK